MIRFSLRKSGENTFGNGLKTLNVAFLQSQARFEIPKKSEYFYRI